MRTLLPLACALLGVTCLVASIPERPTPLLPPELPIPAEPPKPGDCKAGCATVRDPRGKLSTSETHELILAYGKAQSVSALETLLFHGTHVLTHIEQHGLDDIPTAAADELRAELAKTHVRYTLTVRDADDDEIRFVVDDPVPVGKKQHLHPHEARGIASPEIGFTVHRVGVDHLWSRL